ncbi:MAG: hypothetical protein MJ025_04070 [Victivallaceae bacterium]|nr:hypothetical protein [Victivallaceae bacterium]
MSSLKVAAGKNNKTTGHPRQDLVEGWWNALRHRRTDTYAFGNDVTATFGAIDMKGANDKDKLTIGKGLDIMAKDVRGVEIVTLDDISTFGLGSGGIQDKITGSAKDNTLCFDAGGHVREVDLGKGDDLISFTLDNSKLTEADSWTAIDSASESSSTISTAWRSR